MYVWFLVSVLGELLVLPLYFWSLEHTRLQQKYGTAKGIRIGDALGLISGWGFFLFWIGIWVSPQPRFLVPVFQNLSLVVPVVSFSIPLIQLAIFVPFFVLGAWLGIEGTKGTSMKVADTHRSEKVVTTGVYSIIRHPQYVGGLLAHVGISFLLSAWYSLLSTPLMIAVVYLISRKEEVELVKEFGEEYESYQKRVPMLVPRVRSERK
jgi:protein-S-isoprenylcysteine O-methyltransferase Ste14